MRTGDITIILVCVWSCICMKEVQPAYGIAAEILQRILDRSPELYVQSYCTRAPCDIESKPASALA